MVRGVSVIDGCPSRVLGYSVTTSFQIYTSFVVPICVECLLYIIHICADIGTASQHFAEGNVIWGGLTCLFVCLPALGNFAFIISAPQQWPEKTGFGKDNCTFFLKELYHLLLFPVAAVHRFGRRLFWSIEALNLRGSERQHFLLKAAEASPLELYHFLQAYVQSAPQIILQFHIILREDQFRNYDTLTLQVLSITMSIINMAMITMSYQRFESQKIVGRKYPWCTCNPNKQCDANEPTGMHKQIPETPLVPSSSSKLLEDERREMATEDITDCAIEEDEKIINKRKTLNVGAQNFDCFLDKELRKSLQMNSTDDEKVGIVKKPAEDTIEEHNVIVVSAIVEDPRDEIGNYLTIVDKTVEDNEDDEVFIKEEKPPPLLSKGIKDEPPSRPPSMNQRTSQYIAISECTTKHGMNDLSIDAIRSTSDNEIEEQDEQRPMPNPSSSMQPPNFPAPPRPNSLPHSALKRISTFKDMIVFNAETIIDEIPRLHLPHLKKNDEPDSIILPTRVKGIYGLEQEDPLAKTISSLGWFFFIVSRMLAISSFTFFFPYACFYLCLATYFLMVGLLFLESRCRNIYRCYFYLFLGYVYVFVILEFKIKFRRVRYWYGGYILLIFTQNLVTTMVWYLVVDWENWWFQYMFSLIIGSTFLSLACKCLYVLLLKPKDKIIPGV